MSDRCEICGGEISLVHDELYEGRTISRSTWKICVGRRSCPPRYVSQSVSMNLKGVRSTDSSVSYEDIEKWGRATRIER